jgi:ribosomal protein L37AE/L43A
MFTSFEKKRLAVQPYEGACCPRCEARLMTDLVATGLIQCPDCKGFFEATAFKPVTKKPRVVEVSHVGPEGASACANHAGNAAVTSCTRCGLFICALCDMNLGSGSYCPACFDRVRAEGSVEAVAMKTRDYFSMARISAVVGMFFSFFFIGPLFGVMAIVYQSKGRNQRIARGDDPWPGAAIIVTILALLDIAGGALYDIVVFTAMFKGFK